MPRYCAVKACKNRGGAASKDNKRISFYPFPLQDEARLQKWVDNMRREEWTPSRHQYLCSEHFTEDCFDVRWGIRYLKNTAIPTIFPSCPYDVERRAPSKKPRTRISRTSDSDIQPVRPDSPPSKKPLILRRRTRAAESSEDNTSLPIPVVSQSSVPARLEGKPSSDPSEVALGEASPSETQAEVCGSASQLPGDSWGTLPGSCSSVETQQADSSATALRCDSQFSDGQATARGQTFRIVPDEPRGERADDLVREWEGPSEGEHAFVYEHSYSRPDTDRDQLWSRIMSLHSKIVELDRREESTMVKIHSLENEIGHLKRDSVVFKEKQRVLEDYITSVLL